MSVFTNSPSSASPRANSFAALRFSNILRKATRDRDCTGDRTGRQAGRQPLLERETPRVHEANVSTATGIRTRVSAMRGRRPSPLDDSGANSCVEASKALHTTVGASSLVLPLASQSAFTTIRRPSDSAISSQPAPRGCGGIGRRARFRSVWMQVRGGSSPLIRIAEGREYWASCWFEMPLAKPVGSCP
jgi:hypothetical protein